MDVGKDNRAKTNRKIKGQRQSQRKTTGRKSSSSGQMEMVAGVADVADSSDERYIPCKGGWVPPQPSRRYSIDDEPEQDDEDIENAQMHAGDFKLMSELPTSVGSHFQFSSEKQWDIPEAAQYLDDIAAGEYFILNRRLLNVGLHTIPFHKRMDYASSMFSAEQIESMEKDAAEAELLYKGVLKEHQSRSRVTLKSARRRMSSAKSHSSHNKPTSSTTKELNEQKELDELLNMTTDDIVKVSIDNIPPEPELEPVIQSSGQPAVAVANESGKSVGAPIEVDSKLDIQEWLDNVLEE